MLKRNFTLIELVVVLIIICVMGSLTLSTIIRMTSAANDIMCKTNLKKFSDGVQQYSSDNAGFLPFPGIKWTEKQNGIGKYTHSYLSKNIPSKNTESFVCPGDLRAMSELQEGGSKFWVKASEKKWAHYKVSYGINLVVSGIPNNKYWKSHRLTNMANPETCFIFSDSLSRDNPGSIKRFAFRHNKMANIAFADGRVEGMTKEQIPLWQSHLNQPFWVGGLE